MTDDRNDADKAAPKPDASPAPAPKVVEDRVTHAAEESTAVWDESPIDLEKLGISKEPATRPDVGGSQSASVEVSLGRAGGGRPAAPRYNPALAHKPPPSAGVSWPMTIALAVLLGVAVFVVIRFLRG